MPPNEQQVECSPPFLFFKEFEYNLIDLQLFNDSNNQLLLAKKKQPIILIKSHNWSSIATSKIIISTTYPKIEQQTTN